MIGRNGERGSGISALAVRHDDDDDFKINKSCIKIYHQHHRVSLIARFSLTLCLYLCRSVYPFLLSIAPGSSSNLYLYRAVVTVLAGRPTLARLCEGVQTSLMNSSLLLQQCPACLVHLFLTIM